MKLSTLFESSNNIKKDLLKIVYEIQDELIMSAYGNFLTFKINWNNDHYVLLIGTKYNSTTKTVLIDKISIQAMALHLNLKAAVDDILNSFVIICNNSEYKISTYQYSWLITKNVDLYIDNKLICLNQN